MSNQKTLHVQSSPHLNAGSSVDQIMRNVVIALLPSAGFAVYLYGLAALLIIVTACVTCVLTEHLICRLRKQPSTITDWSALITGLIFSLTLPPGLPLWMVVLGAILAMSMGKAVFGGLGCNPFNPALVARAFLQAAFPVHMTTWSDILLEDRFTVIPTSLLAFPFSKPNYDAIVDTTSGSTPLAAFKFDAVTTDLGNLVSGFSTGSIGETCSITLILGGLYLISRNMMNWRIPASIFLTVFIVGGLFYLSDKQFYPSPLFSLFSGGLILGAMFMATDMVASPITSSGCWIYGLIIGLIVLVIRYWAGMPEGVMYAILIGNALSPHIDSLVKPHVYGTTRSEQ